MMHPSTGSGSASLASSTLALVRRQVGRCCGWTTLLLVILAGAVLALGDATTAKSVRDFVASHRSAGLHLTMAVVKSLGKTQCLALLALVAGLSGKKRLGAELLIALVLVAIMVLPLKVIVHRQRPRGNDYHSFPSGDAAAAASQAAVLAATGTVGLVPAFLAVLAVGTDRIAVGAHYPSDVLFGFAVGILAGCLAPGVRRRWGKRIRYRWYIWALLSAALGWGVIHLAGAPAKDLSHLVTTFWPALLMVGSLRAWRRFAYRT